MGVITWVEDEKSYIDDIIAELQDRGHNVTVLTDCGRLLEKLDEIVPTSDVIVLDLWLPVGGGSAVPSNLRNSSKNTDRGLWLYGKVRDAISGVNASTSVVVLSGNLDFDTIQRLTKTYRLPKKYIFKKPVEFYEFVRFVDGLAGRHAVR